MAGHIGQASERFPTLETPRLALREIVDADAGDLLAIHGDAGHMKWFGSDPIQDLGAATALVARFAALREAPVSGARWALERKWQAGLIGTCGLFRWNRNWRSCVVGYEISPLHAGRGYMQEAVRAIAGWGFAHLGLNRIEAQVHAQNRASRALLEKLGFVEEGVLREVGYWGGAHHDLLQYALLRRDWGAVGATAPATLAAQPARDFLARVSAAGSDAPADAGVDAASACLDRFTAAFNARDLAAMDAELHFPHVMLSGAGPLVWERPGRHPPDFFTALRATGWASTRYEQKTPVLAGGDKVHFTVTYTRRDAGGAVLSEHRNLWIVTRVDGRWGIALRSY